MVTGQRFIPTTRLSCLGNTGIQTHDLKKWFKQLQHYKFEKISNFQEQFGAFSYYYRKERYFNLWNSNLWKGVSPDSPEKWNAVSVHQTGAAMSACVAPESQSTGTVTLPLFRSWGKLQGHKAAQGIEIWRLLHLKITLKVHLSNNKIFCFMYSHTHLAAI